MTARARVIDPERNYVLFDTDYPTLCLSCVDYASDDNGGKVSTKNSKGAAFPMVVMPIYPQHTGINPHLGSQTQYPRNPHNYDDIDSQIGVDSPNVKNPIPIFMFDIPELAMNVDGKVGLKVYNPETGAVTFDSRTLPLSVIGLCRDGVKLDPNKFYGYVDLTGGLFAEETRTLGNRIDHYVPYSLKGYFSNNNEIVSAAMSQTVREAGGYYAMKPKKQDIPKLSDPYQKFYAWYWPHLLVDLTHIYNSLGINYQAPFA